MKTLSFGTLSDLCLLADPMVEWRGKGGLANGGPLCAVRQAKSALFEL